MDFYPLSMSTKNRFIKHIHEYWTNYFRRIQLYERSGYLSSTGDLRLYPNILIVTETKSHFLAELIGARPQFDGLTIKQHKAGSVNRYLNQFDDNPGEPTLNFNGYNSITNVCFARVKDVEFIESRFPVIRQFLTRIYTEGGEGSLFSFGPDFESVIFENCLLINRYDSIFRVKHILNLTILSKKISVKRHRSLLDDFLSRDNSVKGIHTCKLGESQDYILSGQLQNLYLFPGLQETTIGEFLNTHPEIIKRALSAKDFIYEPYLLWVEAPKENIDTAINPDLLVQRYDGYYDVYDLKTAALRNRKLTKGKRRRRRFIDYVEEGAAQLANYREYFSYPGNLDHARNKYGVEFKDPKYVLIVGNYENADPVEIQEASRKLDNIIVFDYDTLVQLFLGSAMKS